MKKLIYIILLVLTLITIFLFSSQNGSQSLGLTIKGINKVTNANIEKKEEARPGVPEKEEEKTFYLLIMSLFLLENQLIL